MSPCPSAEMLGRIVHDSSSGSQFASMEAHVEGCPDCQGVLERLAAEASIIEGHGAERRVGPEHPPAIPGFLIERELGRGAMGVVYLAIRTGGLERQVALKILPVASGADESPAARRRWLREARAVSSIRHPNVVTLYEYGEADGSFYLVLEYIPGGTLAKRLGEPLPPRVAAELMVTIARAVGNFHGESGLHHLDLKPSNILLDGEKNAPWERMIPKVSDFGLALSDGDAGPSEASLAGIRGTPSYMAPEQAAAPRGQLGPATDIHAMGAILYELLIGRPPFRGSSTLETLDQVRHQEPVPPRRLVPKLPRDLETIALKCLEKNPARRYTSAEALADDLQRWLDGFSIRARPVSKLEHAGRWCRRRPGFALLLAVLALTVASSLMGLLTLWRHSEGQRMRAETALALALKNEKAASEAVRDLVSHLTTTVNAPQLLAEQRIDSCVRAVRELMAKMREDRGIGDSSVVALCELTIEVSADFRRRSKFAESRALLGDTLELLEGRRSRRAEDYGIGAAYGRVLMERAMVARDQECVDEALDYYRRAEEALEGIANDPRRLAVIVSIDATRREIAWHLAQRGQPEAGRQVLETNRRMLDQLRELAVDDPAIGLLAALDRAWLAADAGTIAMLRGAIQKFPPNGRLPEILEQKVADWIANDINPYSSGVGPDGAPKGRLDPDAHADASIEALNSRCNALGVHPAILALAVQKLAVIASRVSTEHRGAGRLDDARLTTACLSAFARKLVRRNPAEVWFHLIRCEAFEQESKNAWKVQDFPAIEEALRKALGEATAALRLDLRNAAARMKVSGLQDKLVGLASRQPSTP